MNSPSHRFVLRASLATLVALALIGCDASDSDKHAEDAGELSADAADTADTLDNPDADAPDADDASRTLVSAANLRLVGGFRVPQASIDGDNTRYMSGSIDRLNGKWIANHGVSGRIIEYTEPDTMGTGPTDTWPELVPGRNGQPLATVEKVSPSGVHWLDEDRVLASGRKSYRSGFEPKWATIFNLETGDETLLHIEDPSLDENGNFHVQQAFAAGFTRIPQAFADQHTDGRTIGIGRGGYDVLGSPLGPALAAFDLADTQVDYVLLDHPTSHPARRDPDYQYPVDEAGETIHQLPIWRDADETDGFWQAGDVGPAAWVDHDDFKGLVFPVSQGRGALDYRAQGDGGSGAFFTVLDPVTFYSPDSGGGNRGGHEDEPWNQSMPPARYHQSLYVYDPAELAEVLAGEREPWECTAHRSDFPLDDSISWAPEGQRTFSRVRGLFWDDERELIWAVIGNVWNDHRFAVLAAYSLE
ncbi:hypothetical protein FIV42_07475 [Persicimonas caeni]|uniref:Uncharacterized protein n=1 Tax=Persicimonas caeni TaxID=2292766 RepID=A0A4Y6PR33_PERCE|nr:hypothetical protein [Persicimonas caeni]QDG50579.1 hypothetical protein FIV42_07475 [Persicimonas caeni]QED31800.1 hypothetical protein FRD00_07470 [Persicimonas caeni]